MKATFSFLLFILFAACASSEVVQKFGEPVVLKVGGTAAFDGGLHLTFTRVVSDSRCPENVQCIWAGEADVELTATQKGKTAKVALSSGGRNGTNHASAFGYGIELIEVWSQKSAPQITIKVAKPPS